MDNPKQERRNEARRRHGAYESAMAEAAPVVHIGENSPEQIAYKLLLLIASKEGKLIDDCATENRKWLLDTYAECLRTVRNPSSRSK
jgi:hypothetical protein